MSDITIIGPDGNRFVFPAGTSRDVMINAMRRRYTGQERREQTRDMILNSQLPGSGRAGVQDYLSRDQMRQDLAQAREGNIAAQEAALIPEDTTRERFYTGAQGVTLGAAPLIQGAAVAPMAALLYPFLTDEMRAGRSPGEFISDMSGGAYQRARTDIARAREDRPIESLALETAGGLFTGKTVYDALGERFLRKRAAARGGVVGTGAGAQYGFLESEGDPVQTAQAAGMGGLFGAPVGKAIEGIAGLGGRMFQRSRGMEAPEPVTEPEVLPVPEPGQGYLGRRVFDNPPRPPNPRTEAERATWAPTATILEQARTRASEAKAIADQTLQTRRPEDIARVKDQKKALIADIEATMAQREGMNTPDDQRLADALSALSEQTSDPVFMSTQLAVAQRNLDQVMINQGMRPEPMRTPVQTVPPFRPTPSREQQARTISDRPSRTRYATPPDETPMGFNANTAMQVGLGSAGGSVAGSQNDLNGDGVIDMQDVALGSVMGGVGLPLAGRAASRLDNAFGGPRPSIDDAALSAAKTEGFNTNQIFYRGMRQPLGKDGFYPTVTRGYETQGSGVSLSTSRKAAAEYGENVYPVVVRGKFFSEKQFENRVNDLFKKEGIGSRDAAARVRAQLKAEGYAGLKSDGGKLLDKGEVRVWDDDDYGMSNVMAVGGNRDVRGMGFGADDVPRPVQQARQSGYEGSDTGESKEWLSAVRKGLAMDTESRMARAREMGFDTDTVLYHGTDADVKQFSSGRGYGGGSKGIWFSDNPKVAGEYSGDSGNIVPVFTKRGKTVDLEDSRQAIPALRKIWDDGLKDDWADEFNYRAEMNGTDPFHEFSERVMSGDIWATGDNKMSFQNDVLDWLANDFDSVAVDDSVGGIRNKSIVIFDPSNIRSVNAAFDPDNAGSSTLLAAAPFAVGGVGATAAMQENDQ